MKKMSVKELYEHITKHMTPEDALMRLLEGTVINYEKLRFQEGEEIHPLMIISMAAFELGWNLAIPEGNDEEEIQGMVVGTQAYLDEIFPEDDKEK